jgi:hypothetical protein
MLGKIKNENALVQRVKEKLTLKNIPDIILFK